MQNHMQKFMQGNLQRDLFHKQNRRRGRFVLLKTAKVPHRAHRLLENPNSLNISYFCGIAMIYSILASRIKEYRRFGENLREQALKLSAKYRLSELTKTICDWLKPILNKRSTSNNYLVCNLFGLFRADFGRFYHRLPPVVRD